MNMGDKIDNAVQQLFNMAHKERLWKNAAPESAFPAQELKVNSKGFDYLAIETLNTPYNNWDVTQVEFVGKRGAAVLQFLSAVGGGGLKGVTRAIPTITDNSIKFDEGFERYGATAGPNNMYLVPINIYGLKIIGGGGNA